MPVVRPMIAKWRIRQSNLLSDSSNTLGCRSVSFLEFPRNNDLGITKSTIISTSVRNDAREGRGARSGLLLRN